MGRPWWYDSYWENDRRPKQRSRLPGRRSLVWIVLLLISLALAMNSTVFRPIWLAWLLGFVSALCQILALSILVRVILSWFTISRRNRLLVLLDYVTEPILSPLRRVAPSLGVFDITPLIAMVILYFIPLLLHRLAGILGL